MPGLLIFCVFGTYAIQNSHFDSLVMFAAGFLGFFMMKINLPVPPFLIAFVLGPSFEDNLRRTILVSHGDYSVFFNSYICWFFAALTVLSVGYGVLSSRRSRSSAETTVEGNPGHSS